MSKLYLGTLSDIPHVSNMAEEAYQDFEYGSEFSHEQTQNFLKASLDNGVTILSESGEEKYAGVLVAIKTFMSCSFAPIAYEMLWYVRPQFRKSRIAIELHAAFEYWASKEKCELIMMSNKANEYQDRTERFFVKHGYKLSEQSYFKRIA